MDIISTPARNTAHEWTSSSRKAPTTQASTAHANAQTQTQAPIPTDAPTHIWTPRCHHCRRQRQMTATIQHLLLALTSCFVNTECGNFDCVPTNTVDTTGGYIQDRARVRFSVNMSVSLCHSFARSLVQNHRSSRGPSALNTSRVEFNPTCVRENVSVQFVLPCSFFCKRVVAHGGHLCHLLEIRYLQKSGVRAARKIFNRSWPIVCYSADCEHRTTSCVSETLMSPLR